MKGNMKGITPIMAVLAVVILLAAFGVLNLSGITGFAAAPGITPTTPTGVVVTQEQCQTDGTNTLGVVVRNPLATTVTDYTRASIVAFGSDGQLVATGTSDGSATLTFTDLNIPCQPGKLTGTINVLSGTTDPGSAVNYVTGTYDLTGGRLSDQVILAASNNTNLNLCIRATTDRSNVTEGCDTANTANETAAVTMGANDVRSRIITFQGVTGSSQFGSQLGLLWQIDTVDSTVFADKSIALSSGFVALTEVDCPQRATSFNSANRCYTSPAIKTSDGLLEATVTISADLGNPGSSADPFVYIDDIQCFEEDAQLVCDTHDKGGTNVGVARQRLAFDNS